MRSEHWRFIQYADGNWELYDILKDPNEWNNLAHDSKYAEVIAQHKKYYQKPHARPGRPLCILTYKDGKVIWQGEEVQPERIPIPGLEWGNLLGVLLSKHLQQHGVWSFLI